MIQIRNLSKSFPSANGPFNALSDVSLTVNDGDIYGIIGMSGAGKSTLVRCINMLERPTKGSVIIDGKDVSSLSEKQLRSYRRNVSMIFQSFNLLSQRNCLKNVCFPLELAGVKKEEATRRAKELLALVGIAEKEQAYPSQLSGGQQQRVAIARALATNPKILLCDEATSALDPKTTESILQLLRNINKELGITIVIITHQMSIVEEICTRVAILENGSVAEEGPVSEVFSRPRSAAAKALVFPDMPKDGEYTKHAGERLVRLVFHGAKATGTPFIARLAMEKQIAVNILSANAKNIGDKIYGNMLLGIPADEPSFLTAVNYLSSLPDLALETVDEPKEKNRV